MLLIYIFLRHASKYNLKYNFKINKRRNEKHKKIVICTDSRNLLDKCNSTTNSKQIYLAITILNTRTIFLWVSWDVGVRGNKEADEKQDQQLEIVLVVYQYHTTTCVQSSSRILAKIIIGNEITQPVIN